MSTNPRPAEREVEQLQEEEREVQRRVEEAAQAAGEEQVAKGATPEQVTAAVEKARTEEKNKLYPQLTALRDSIKEIQETLRQEREEKETIKREHAEQQERDRQAKLSDNERQLEAIARIEEQLRDERAARERLERDAEANELRRTLADYKRQAIRDAGDEILPELVGGTTEAEIDISIETAKARYAELAEKFRQEHGDRVRGNFGRPTNPNTEALEEEELNEQLTAVDHDKYLRDPDYRDRIKRELEGAYARAAGRV